MTPDRPLISFVVAMTPDRVIGRDNRLPWHVPADLAHFKRMTLGKPIVMGRRTYESIGHPLPQRRNIVVTRDRAFVAEGCVVAHGIDDALRAAGDVPEIAVIGGADIFRALMSRVDILYLTYIHAAIEGDTYFPRFDPGDWIEHHREERDIGPGNACPLTFLTCYRRGAGETRSS